MAFSFQNMATIGSKADPSVTTNPNIVTNTIGQNNSGLISGATASASPTNSTTSANPIGSPTGSGGGGGSNPYNFSSATNVNPSAVNSSVSVPSVSNQSTLGSVAQNNTSAFNPNTTSTKATEQASTYNPATATGTNWDVNQNQTVAGQLSGILSSNSPLLQQAQARALQAMNSRGLLNSSMAVGAGESALYDAALPIAQADASTYANSGRYNADVANNMSQFNANANNTASQFNAGATQQASRDNAAASNNLQSQLLQTQAQMDMANTEAKNKALSQDSQQNLQAQLSNQDAAKAIGMQQYDAAVKTAMQNADSQNKLQLQQLDAVTRTQIEQIDAQYKNQMQTNQSMAQAYSAMLDSFTKIMQDKDMDANSKQAAINQMGALYKNNMDTLAAIGGLNLQTTLDFSNMGYGAVTGNTQAGNQTPTANPLPASSTGSGSITSRFQGG